MRLPQPFIQLPYQFDADQLAREMARLPASAWMEHPSGMAGNSAVALVSRDGGDNDDFGGRMLATPHLQSSPYHQQVMASFNEVLGRSRLMRLGPGAEVSRHVDFNYHWYSRLRVHVPIVTNPDVAFQCGEDEVHMRAGECWIFDSWRWHRVINGGTDDRTHLVIDVSGSSRFWNMVDRSIENEVGAAGIERHHYRPDFVPQLRTELYNTAPVMAPGEVEAIARELIRDFEACDANPAERVATYRRLLLDFGRDWRELWYQFGHSPEGWPRYRELIQHTQQRLHPDRRALVTASNNVGVNPIIVQRLLRPALATEQFDVFHNGLPGAESAV